MHATKFAPPAVASSSVSVFVAPTGKFVAPQASAQARKELVSQINLHGRAKPLGSLVNSDARVESGTHTVDQIT